MIVYPQIALFSGAYIARSVLPDGAFYFFFNILVNALFLLNVWWFHFIITLIIRIATGQTRGVEDTREYCDKKEEVEFSNKLNGHSIKNGKHDVNRKIRYRY